MSRYICPYCGEPLANAQTPHCSEAGHAELIDEAEEQELQNEFAAFLMDEQLESP